jgi:hypothetical protein
MIKNPSIVIIGGFFSAKKFIFTKELWMVSSAGLVSI